MIMREVEFDSIGRRQADRKTEKNSTDKPNDPRVRSNPSSDDFLLKLFSTEPLQFFETMVLTTKLDEY